MVLLLNQQLGMLTTFTSNDNSDAESLLKFDFTRKDNRLNNKNIMIGEKARQFIKSMNLNADSPELKQFFDAVNLYYTGSTKSMIKYFTPGLTNRILRYLSVLDPTEKSLPVNIVRRKWMYLAQKFPNIVPENMLDDLELEVVQYSMLQDPDKDETVDGWFAALSVKETEGKSNCYD